MENFLINIKQLFDIFTYKEVFSFCATIFLLIAGVFLNFLVLKFSKNKFSVKKISDIITFSIFFINTLIFGALALFSNTLFFLKGNIYFFKNSLYLLFIVNLFLLLTTLCFTKLLKKLHHKTALVNSDLLIAALFSNLLFILNNPLFAFIALDIAIWMSYKYCADMRSDTQKIYSAAAAFIFVISSSLFYLFYLLNYLAEIPIQKTIIQVCLSVAFLLKIGIFPVYNYLQAKSNKANLPYNLLILNYVPYLGIIYLSKFMGLLNLNDEIYQITLFIFLLLSAAFYSVYAFKTNNAVKILANSFYYFMTLIVLNIVMFSFDNSGLRLASILLFSYLGIYSIFTVLKINFASNTFNLNAFRGLNTNNSVQSFFLSLLILFSTGIIPGVVSIDVLKIFKNIYLYDAVAVFNVLILAFSYIILVFGILRIVQNIYQKSDLTTKEKMKKRTTLNYAVLFVVILFLIINSIL